MAQFANGALYVEYFTPTGNPGEYTFENGVFNIQNDSTGMGAFLIDTSYVVFVPIVDVNTALLIVGGYSRYKLTSVVATDTSLVNGTIVFDEEGAIESGSPATGAFCLLAPTSPNLKLAAPPIDSLYEDLVAGGTISAMLNDLINRVDKISGAGTVTPALPKQLPIVSIGQTVFDLYTTVQSPESCMLFVNGVYYSYGASKDYVISGSTLTWTGSFELDPSDSMVLRT